MCEALSAVPGASGVPHELSDCLSIDEQAIINERWESPQDPPRCGLGQGSRVAVGTNHRAELLNPKLQLRGPT